MPNEPNILAPTGTPFLEPKERTLGEQEVASVNAGRSKEEFRQLVLDKYGIDPKLLDPSVPYSLVKRAGPKLSKLIGPSPAEALDTATARPDYEALKAGAHTDLDTGAQESTHEKLVGGLIHPIEHAERIKNLAIGAADSFYPEHELQTVDHYKVQAEGKDRDLTDASKNAILAHQQLQKIGLISKSAPAPKGEYKTPKHDLDQFKSPQAKVAIAQNELGLPTHSQFAGMPTTAEIAQEQYKPKAKPSAIERAWKSGEAQLHKDFEEHPYLGPAYDVQNVMSGLIDLASKAVLPEWTPISPEDPEGKASAAQQNQEFGKNFAAGVVGGIPRSLVDVVKHPIETVVERPLSTAMVVGPTALSGYKAFKGPKTPLMEPPFPTEAVEPVPSQPPTKALGQPAPQLGMPNVPEVQSTHLSDVHHAGAGLPSPLTKLGAWLSDKYDATSAGKVTQWLADGLRQRDPRATALVEEWVKDTQHKEASINSQSPQLMEHLGKPEAKVAFDKAAKNAQGTTKAPVQPKTYPIEVYPRSGEAVPAPNKISSAERLRTEGIDQPVQDAVWDDVVQYLDENHPVKKQIDRIAQGIKDLANPKDLGTEEGILDTVRYRLGSLMRDKAPALLRDDITRRKVVDAIVKGEKEKPGAPQSEADWAKYRKNLDESLLKVVAETKARSTAGFGIPEAATLDDALAHEHAPPVERPYPKGHRHEGLGRQEALAKDIAAAQDVSARLQEIRDNEARAVKELRDPLDAKLAELDEFRDRDLRNPHTNAERASINALAAKTRRRIVAKVEDQVLKEYTKTRNLEDKIYKQSQDRVKSLREEAQESQSNYETERLDRLEKLRQRISDERLAEHKGGLADVATGVEYEPQLANKETYGGGIKSLMVPAGVRSYLAHVIEQMHPDEQSRVRAEVAKATVADMAHAAAKEGLRRGLELEADRSMQGAEPPASGQPSPDMQKAFAKLAPDLAEKQQESSARSTMVRGWAKKWADHIINGGLEPQIIPKKLHGVEVTPIDFANGLRDAAQFIHDASKRNKVMKVAGRLSEYEPFDTEHVPVDAYAPPRMRSALEWESKSREGVKGVVGAINSWVAANQVGRSPTALVNNTLSNTAVMALKYGEAIGPFLVKKMAMGALEFERYLKSGKASPEDRAFFEAYRDSGSMDSDRITQNVGADAKNLGDIAKGLGDLASPGIADKFVDKLPSPNKALNEFMETNYKRFGDQMFKLYTAKKEFGRLSGYLDQLEPGQFVDLNMGPRKTAHVTLRPDGNFDVTGSKAIETTPRIMSREQVTQELVGKAMVQPGSGIFNDYGEKGNYPKSLRGSHLPLVPILSQYYSFFYAVSDLPGIKKGIFQHILGAPGDVATNSPAIRASMVADAASVALRRAMIITGIRQDLSDRHNNDLMKVFKWAPQDLKIGLATALTEPDTVSILDLSNANSLEPSMKAFSIIPSIIEAFKDDPVKFAAKHPKDAKGMQALLDLHEAGASGKTLFEIAGLGGSWLAQMYQRAVDTDREGKTLDAADYWDMLGSQVLSPMGAKTVAGIDSAIIEKTHAYPNPEDSFLERVAKAPFSAEAKTLGRDAFADFTSTYVKSILSLGWKTQALFTAENSGAADEVYASQKRELKSAFGVPKGEHLLNGLDSRGIQNAGTRNLDQKVDIYKDVIDEAVDSAKDNLDKILLKLGIQRRGMLPKPKGVQGVKSN